MQSRYRKDPETTLVIGKLADNVEALTKHPERHILSFPGPGTGDRAELPGHSAGAVWRKTKRSPGTPTSDGPPLHAGTLPLQIHTENAVEKGIRNREGAGQFLLRVRRLEDGCEIVIEDDGRGRSEQKEFYAERKGSTAVMPS
ncbi:MAG: hypothetical protein IPN74_20440 [Haliscomenobacter sp.]|nr:hypothetical protein [Haliscomenobacter sp.]